MTKSFDKLKAELQQIKEKYEMKDIITKLDARKAIIKEESKLTKQVKKAGKLSPGGLDCFKEENMYHSEKDISRYLEDTSYMDAYHASKLDSEWN
jgi:5'-deoxynucleotidase YfbR-like HD superfamily hydrolase